MQLGQKRHSESAHGTHTYISKYEELNSYVVLNKNHLGREFMPLDHLMQESTASQGGEARKEQEGGSLLTEAEYIY